MVVHVTFPRQAAQLKALLGDENTCHESSLSLAYVKVLTMFTLIPMILRNTPTQYLSQYFEYSEISLDYRIDV